MKILKNQKGISLIEILVVLGLIVTFLGSVQLSERTTRSLLRSESQKLVNLFRYLYFQSSTQSLYNRIVFNLDEGSYKVQSSLDPFYIVEEDDEKEKLRLENKEERLSQADLDSDNFDDEESSDEIEEDVEARFEESYDDLIDEEKSLPEDIQILGVYFSHMKELQEDGTQELYFFPNGQTQFGVIYLGNDESEVYFTLIINPLNAFVDVRYEYVDFDDIKEEFGLNLE